MKNCSHKKRPAYLLECMIEDVVLYCKLTKLKYIET